MSKKKDVEWYRLRKESTRIIAFVYESTGQEWKSVREALKYICDMTGVDPWSGRRSDVTIACMQRLKEQGFVVPFSYIVPWQRHGKPAVFKDSKNVDRAMIMAFYSSWEWQHLRYDVLKERGYACDCCGADRATDRSVRINVDHIKPVRYFWHLRLEKSNCQVLCEACNKGKSFRDQSDFRPDHIKARYGVEPTPIAARRAKPVDAPKPVTTSSGQKYLIRHKGKKIKAHLWSGADTACRMASTGGLKMQRFDVFDSPQGHEICQMCRINAGKKHSVFRCEAA